MATEYSRILMRRRALAEWEGLNEILMEGEFGIVLETSPAKYKIGDGITPWSELPYVLDNETIQEAIDALQAGQITAQIGVAPPVNVSLANVDTAGTYPEYSGLTVTSADLLAGFVQFFKKGSVWEKVIKPVPGLSAYTTKSELETKLVTTTGDGIQLIDKDGNIILQTSSDGSIEVIDLLLQILKVGSKISLSNYDIATIPGYAFVDYDSEGFIRWGITDDGKFIGSTDNGGGSITPTTVKPLLKSDMIWKSVYGQSLSLASPADGDVAVHTTARPNLFMFYGGVNSIRAVDANTRTNSIVPLIEGPYAPSTQTTETLGYSIGSTFLEALLTENKFTIDTDNQFDVLVSSDGNGGMSVLQLSKGTSHYTRWYASLTAAKARANELGKTLKCLTIDWIQGEQDIENLTTKADYKARVLQLYNDMSSDIKLVTGQTEDPIFVMAQTASHNHYNMYPEIAIAQYELCVENANFELGSCLYHFDYQSGSTGIPNANVHMSRDSYMKMASDLSYTGKRRLIEADKKKFIYPISIFVQGNIIEIIFNKNYGRLVFDTATVTDPGNYGFNVRSVSGISGTNITISSVKIVREDTIRIVLSQPVVAGNSLTYGQNGLPSRDGRSVGARGCLRDQTGDLHKRNIYPGEEYRLDKWCPIFEKIF